MSTESAYRTFETPRGTTATGRVIDRQLDADLSTGTESLLCVEVSSGARFWIPESETEAVQDG